MHTEGESLAMPSEHAVRTAVVLLRMLADPSRMKIVLALLHGESSVACLADITGVAPTAVSQHLAKLRLSGLVSRRRDRTFVVYSIDDPVVGKVVERALARAPTAIDA